jgi:hypothetical protein
MKNIIYIDSLNAATKKNVKTLNNEGLEIFYYKGFDYALEDLSSKPIQIDALLCAEKIGSKVAIDFLRIAKERRLLERTTPIIILGEGQDPINALKYLAAGAIDYNIGKDPNIILAKLQSLFKISANQNFQINNCDTSKEELRVLQLLRLDFLELLKKIPNSSGNNIMIEKILGKLSLYIDKKMANEELKSLNQANLKTDLKI